DLRAVPVPAASQLPGGRARRHRTPAGAHGLDQRGRGHRGERCPAADTARRRGTGAAEPGVTDVDLLVAGGGPVGLAVAIGARAAGPSGAAAEPREGPLDKA